MKFPMTVYALRNEVTGNLYVGRSVNPRARLMAHMNALKRGAHPVVDMQADFDEYGDHFRFFVLDKIENWDERGKELEWQKRLNTIDRRYGYNYRDPLVVHYGRAKVKRT